MDSQRLGTGLGMSVMGAPGLQGSGQRTLRIVVEQPLQGRQQLPHLPTVALAEQQAGEAVSVQGHDPPTGQPAARIVQQVRQQARPGAQVVIMSNGGFGGLHGKLAAALAE